MGDHNDGLALRQLRKRGLHLRLVVGVGKGRGLIEDQDGGIFQHGARNGNALLLATGEIHALRADDGVDAVREFFDNIHALRSSQGGKRLCLRGVGPAQLDVVQDAALEQAAVLEHERDRVHQLFLRDIAHVRAADADAAAAHVEEAADEACQRGLAAAGRADERHGLSRADVHGNAADHVRPAVIAEPHIMQGDRAVLRVLRLFTHGHRRLVQHGVDAAQRIGHDHLVLAHIHDLRQRQRDNRRDDDVKQQIQQEFRGNAVSRQQQAARDEEGKHAVDGRRIEEHRHPQLFRVGNDPLFIFVDRRLELFERKHGLTERLDDRNAADIFHGLAGHGGKGIAVLAHFLRHALAGHGRHDHKAEGHRHKAQQAQPPVKDEQQHQQADRRCHGGILIRQLMGKIGLRRAGALLNDLAELAAAVALRKAQR